VGIAPRIGLLRRPLFLPVRFTRRPSHASLYRYCANRAGYLTCCDALGEITMPKRPDVVQRSEFS